MALVVVAPAVVAVAGPVAAAVAAGQADHNIGLWQYLNVIGVSDWAPLYFIFILSSKALLSKGREGCSTHIQPRA